MLTRWKEGTAMMKEMFIKNNRSGRTLTPIGIVIHETANPGAMAYNHYVYFNSAYRGASAHVFVDWVESIKIVPFREQAWHAGPTANSKFIGIELCRPSVHDPEKFNIVWNNAVELFAETFINLGITEINKDNLISHAEVSAKWKETDHTDPVSYFQEYGKTVDDFRSAVQNAINDRRKKEELQQAISRLSPAIITDVSKWLYKATNDDDIYWLIIKMSKAV